MRSRKLFLGIWLLVFCLALSGCNWFNDQPSRPAPVRPKVPNPTVRPAPTKRVPGVKALTENDLLNRIAKIEKATNDGNWDTANRETNLLGVDMSRFRTKNTPAGKSLRDISLFNVNYTKLQAAVKIRDKAAALKNLKELKNNIQNLKQDKT